MYRYALEYLAVCAGPAVVDELNEMMECTLTEEQWDKEIGEMAVALDLIIEKYEPQEQMAIIT